LIYLTQVAKTIFPLNRIEKSLPMTDTTSTVDVIIVPEALCQELISPAEAFDAVRDVFAAMSAGDAYNFPVIREAIGHKDALYGFKSGFDKAKLTLGLKSGGYWPGNMERGLTNHQSTIFLFDPDTGRLKAMVGGNYLTAVRTAAASAVSIDYLARKDAGVIGMLGAGHQAAFQLRAALEKRSFNKVIAWNRNPAALSRLEAVAIEAELPFESVSLEQLGAQSDVIITIISAHEPLLMKEWVKPGTHIACMGTDTRGKQEVDENLVATASVFTDELAQSVTIGEAQHAVNNGLITAEQITPIGDVIRSVHAGRTFDQEVTLFDGTGVGLQDLAVAAVAAETAKNQGKAQIAVL
jgi:alanine dehydrogenase